MLKHYLRTLWKQLLKHPLFSLVNIGGLSLGLAVFLLIGLHVRNELSYDKHWTNAGHLYRLVGEFRPPGAEPLGITGAPLSLAPLLGEYFSTEVAASARLSRRQGSVQDGMEGQSLYMAYTNPEILTLFDFEVVGGSMEEALSSPGRIALDEGSAERLFGGEDPVGRTLTFQESGQEAEDFLIAAVFRLPSDNTVMTLPALSRLSDGKIAAMEEKGGANLSALHYFLLREGADAEDINRRMPDFFSHSLEGRDGYMPKSLSVYALQELGDVHLNPIAGEQRGSMEQLLILSAIAALVLFIGGVNFVLLSTARAVERGREVGIRKALGAGRRQLLWQFLGESVLHAFLALAVAMGLALLAQPWFSTLTGSSHDLGLVDFPVPLYLLGVVLAVGLLGGCYPALALARLPPDRALKSAAPLSGGRPALRGLLVCFQFAISTALLTATGVLQAQLSFSRDKDPGFDAAGIAYLGLYAPEARERHDVLLNRVRQLPGIEKAVGGPVPVRLGTFTFVSFRNPQAANLEADTQGMWVGEEFFELYRIPLLAGRAFDAARDTGDQERAREDNAPPRRMIINRSAANALGFALPGEAVGQIVHSHFERPDGSSGGMPHEIIGVSEDNHFRSLRDPIGPEIFFLSSADQPPYSIAIRPGPAAREGLMEELEGIWREVVGDVNLMAGFADQLLAGEFNREEREGRLLTILALLAIGVSCLGLYGMTDFLVKRRVKEVGVRKVLGAGSGGLFVLFLWQLSRPVLWANLIAWPLGLWAMLNWLQRFPEQIDYWLLPFLCLLAGLGALLIAWLTVGLTVARAVREKPVASLRYE